MGGLRVCSHFSKSKGWYNPPQCLSLTKIIILLGDKGGLIQTFLHGPPTPSPAEMYRDNTTNGNFVELHVFKKILRGHTY